MLKITKKIKYKFLCLLFNNFELYFMSNIFKNNFLSTKQISFYRDLGIVDAIGDGIVTIKGLSM